MTETNIRKYIFQGYNDSLLNILKLPRKQIKSQTYTYKKKVYTPQEYAFKFPSWYDKRDYIEIGKDLRKLEISLTHNDLLLDHLQFNGKMRDIDDLHIMVCHNTIYEKPNPRCKFILERVPLEVNRDSGLGQYSVYMRIGAIITNASPSN